MFTRCLVVKIPSNGVSIYTHAFATPRDPLSPGCRKRGPTNCDDVLHGQKMLGPNGIGNTGRLECFEGVNLHISIHFLVFKTEETFMIYERIQTLTCEHVHTYLFGLVDGIPTWGDCIYIYIIKCWAWEASIYIKEIIRYMKINVFFFQSAL